MKDQPVGVCLVLSSVGISHVPPNHCSNGDTMIEYINEILILFITVKRKELKLAADYQRAMYR